MTEKIGVVYLLKDKFQLYDPNYGRVSEFRFVPTIIRDLDVINSELLENYIKIFIANGKIAPLNLVFVLAESAYFVKDFVIPARQKTTPPSAQPEVTKEILQKQADEFIEHVPFDNVVSKTIPLKDGIKVCAANKDFYESVAIAFEHQGFTVDSVLPGIVLGNGLSLRPVLDPAMANMILQKTNAVKLYNLLNQQVFQPLTKQETEEIDEVEVERLAPKKANKKSIYALAGIAPVLVGLFVVVYMQLTAPPPNWRTHASNQAPPPPANPVQLATIIPTAPPAISISNSSSSSSSGQLQTQGLTVQIVNTTESATIAQQLQGNLDTYRFKSVSLQTQSGVESSGSLVSFAPAVSQDVRDAVLVEVKKFETNVIVQEKQLGVYDISIVLGQ